MWTRLVSGVSRLGLQSSPIPSIFPVVSRLVGIEVNFPLYVQLRLELRIFGLNNSFLNEIFPVVSRLVGMEVNFPLHVQLPLELRIFGLNNSFLNEITKLAFLCLK